MSSRLIVRDIERRITARFMDLLVLSILNHDGGGISGYDLIKHFHSKFGFLMSPGTVYSQLNAMEREGLLKSQQNGGKRVFLLTQRGKEKSKIILNAEDKILKSMARLFDSKGL